MCWGLRMLMNLELMRLPAASCEIQTALTNFGNANRKRKTFNNAIAPPPVKDRYTGWICLSRIFEQNDSKKNTPADGRNERHAKCRQGKSSFLEIFCRCLRNSAYWQRCLKSLSLYNNYNTGTAIGMRLCLPNRKQPAGEQWCFQTRQRARKFRIIKTHRCLLLSSRRKWTHRKYCCSILGQPDQRCVFNAYQNGYKAPEGKQYQL